MITIEIGNKYSNFINEYAEKQNIGGFSNLNKEDLAKASRLDYQKVAIGGEIAWNIYRYGNIDKLKNILDYKFQTLRPTKKGDDGFDDAVEKNGKTRLIDVKTSHVVDINKIKYLNLIIPKREYHKNMIYISAFSVGKDRQTIDTVILAGWAATENIYKKWKFDENKYCVPVQDLRDIKELNDYYKWKT